MRLSVGTRDITGAVQVSNTADRVRSIALKARSANTGASYVGITGLTTSNAWEMLPGESVEIDFQDGSVLFSDIWLHTATSGNDVDWMAILI